VPGFAWPDVLIATEPAWYPDGATRSSGSLKNVHRERERGVQFSLGLDIGMTHVNDTIVDDLSNDLFGSKKSSGTGRITGAAVHSWHASRRVSCHALLVT
jgi:hypothetical protein